MRTFTLEEVLAAGWPAEAFNADRIQFQYDPLGGDEQAMRYFVQGHWHALHMVALRLLMGHPKAALGLPSNPGRQIMVPRDGWRHWPDCECRMCQKDEPGTVA